MAGATASGGAAAAAAAAGATGVGSPCGACKFLRRRCVPDCVFAPYFSSDQGAARFAAIHKVFGASNASKLLSHLPVADRCEAVVTITYEAQARLRDPVYGCVAQIFALQQQVAILQAQLMQAKAHLACGVQGTAHSPVSHHQWPDHGSITALLRQDTACSARRPAPLDDCFMPDLMAAGFRDDVAAQHCAKADAGDLQYLAQAMMRSPNYSL
ncbi:LOB domain-containing protein 16 [Dichanthelium oligosanthes]|uniref:LOB domain-containing protein 16 n=1 Tax=Dichanthelium oligosanthes TaxID=888268 RepID=A0A1E5WH05_9POAL|nr:LOB domain-containing protein 16 [Dichanthelium oligosanthes]